MICQRVSPVAVVDFVSRTMKGIGAELGDVVHNTSSVPAIFRAVVGKDLHFGHGILISEEDHGAADGSIVVALSVDLEIVIARALAVYRELRSALIAKSGISGGNYTWRKQRYDIETITHWQICKLLGLERLPNLHCVSLQNRSASLDGD